MKITDHQAFISSGSARLVISGEGRIFLLIASHNQASAQTITLYDGLSTAGIPCMKLVLPADSPPVVIHWPVGFELRFHLGLYLDPAGAEVWVAGNVYR